MANVSLCYTPGLSTPALRVAQHHRASSPNSSPRAQLMAQKMAAKSELDTLKGVFVDIAYFDLVNLFTPVKPDGQAELIRERAGFKTLNSDRSPSSQALKSHGGPVTTDNVLVKECVRSLADDGIIILEPNPLTEEQSHLDIIEDDDGCWSEESVSSDDEYGKWETAQLR